MESIELARISDSEGPLSKAKSASINKIANISCAEKEIKYTAKKGIQINMTKYKIGST